MAARTVKIRHDGETRAKIRASQLINRLQNHVFKNAEISATQMKAIEILLRKSLPDLSAVELTGKDGAPMDINVNVTDTDRAKALAVFLAKTMPKGEK
jgi:hypothetical protein